MHDIVARGLGLRLADLRLEMVESCLPRLAFYDSFRSWPVPGPSPTLVFYNSFHSSIVPTLAFHDSFHSSIVLTLAI